MLPENWEIDPNTVETRNLKYIDVKEVWKNKVNNSILVLYSTMTQDSRNIYLEIHEDPETSTSRLKKLEDLVKNKDVETEINNVQPSSGRTVFTGRDSNQARKEAQTYMWNTV